MITEDWVKDKLKSKIVNGNIVLEEWIDKNKAVNKICVPVKKFVELFRDGVKKNDVLGYDKYIDGWKKEGLI